MHNNNGYRWPAEWEPHDATWVAWPHNRKTWPGRFDGVAEQFARLVQAIAAFEPVHVLAGGQAVMDKARSTVGQLANVTLHGIATDDAWVRDYGPMFLTRERGGSLAIIDWTFNAWGGRYPPWNRDNAVPQQIAAQLDLPRYCPGLVLEGGSVDGNGRGMALTTESCLLAPNRNRGSSREAIERCLCEQCGVTTVIWLPGDPLAGDDTDGHVDQVARFVAPDHVVASVEDDSQDENHASLEQNLAVLKLLKSQSGEPLKVTCLPMPAARVINGQRVPASYCNFYMANRCAVVPLFGDAMDQVALERLQSAMPKRQVFGLPAENLIWGLGAFHCLTQQQPAVKSQGTPRPPPA